jgi:hypothetical protein
LDLEKYEGDFDSDEDNAKTRCERGKKIQQHIAKGICYNNLDIKSVIMLPSA